MAPVNKKQEPCGPGLTLLQLFPIWKQLRRSIFVFFALDLLGFFGGQYLCGVDGGNDRVA